MCRFIKVSGESLSPLFHDGDFVLVIKIPFSFLKIGDIFVFRHRFYGTMIKVVEEKFVEERVVSAVGIHPQSTSSHSIGRIANKDILGKVIWRIRKQG